MDIIERASAFSHAQAARDAGLYPYFTIFDGPDATVARLSTGQEVIMCGGNNYLGLTSDHRVRAAAKAAIDEYGTSRTGSRMLNGNTPLHHELETELADFLGMPAALVFPTGYQANVGIVAGLPSRHDVVIIDREAHASVYDACGMGQAKVRRFAHNDAADLDAKLASCPPDAGRLVIVDGVYSMGGDLPPLHDIVTVCRRHGARLMVDDAHGIGVLGRGRGTCAHLGLTGAVDLVTVTFSKSLASIGGAVLGSRELVEYLRHAARSQIFSAAAPPASLAAALAALRVVRAEPWRAERAMDNGRRLREGLVERGYRPLPTGTPIVCLPTPDVAATLLAWRGLLERGVYVNAVIPPAASPRLRLSVGAAHTDRQLARTLDAFEDVAPLLLDPDAARLVPDELAPALAS